MPNNEIKMEDLSWTGTEKALNELLGLKFGWDGDVAHPISQASVKAAESLFLFLKNTNMPPPVVAANKNGSLSLNWRNSLCDIHLEIGEVKFNGYIDYIESRDEDILYLSGTLKEINFILSDRIEKRFLGLPETKKIIGNKI